MAKLGRLSGGNAVSAHDDLAMITYEMKMETKKGYQFGGLLSGSVFGMWTRTPGCPRQISAYCGWLRGRMLREKGVFRVIWENGIGGNGCHQWRFPVDADGRIVVPYRHLNPELPWLDLNVAFENGKSRSDNWVDLAGGIRVMRYNFNKGEKVYSILFNEFAARRELLARLLDAPESFWEATDSCYFPQGKKPF